MTSFSGAGAPLSAREGPGSRVDAIDPSNSAMLDASLTEELHSILFLFRAAVKVAVLRFQRLWRRGALFLTRAASVAAHSFPGLLRRRSILFRFSLIRAVGVAVPPSRRGARGHSFVA
jgi:hypothetical protein